MLLATGGDFSRLEFHVQRQMQKESEDAISGGWVNEIYLKNVKYWDDAMIEHSKQWAIARGLHRCSAVHGKDEWKIPLDETFMFRNKSSETVTASAGAEGEARSSDYSVQRSFS